LNTGAPALRSAEPGDAAAVEALVQAAYQVYVDELGLRPAPMKADQAAEIASKEVWVAEVDGEIVGVVVARPEADHVFVDNVAVDPAAQGEGVGRALLERAEQRAAELGVGEIRLLTNVRMTANRALYAHLGWDEAEVREEHGYERVYLRKPVAAAPG
jgi:N-acetylglutamate synthase-like GNAT family acetyltransferase